MNPGRVWIAWEKQRRSLSLSRRLGARLRLYERGGSLRYPLCAAATAAELGRCRGRTVFVQNPSQVLAALACVLKPLFGYRLVVDRHSNFSELWDSVPAPVRAGPGEPAWKRALGSALSRFSLRRADLTLVTNAELAAVVERQGGRAFVLPDPFPELEVREAPPVAAAPPAQILPREILFVSSWAADEPILEAIEACRRLRGEVNLRITGRMKPAYADAVAAAPDNFIPTGFLPDAGFFALMARCDAVMAVTRRRATLVCGAYEAAALGKPLILGDSAALREYFDAGAVYTDATPGDLERKIRLLLAELPRHREAVADLRLRREGQWRHRLRALERVLEAEDLQARGLRFVIDPASREVTVDLPGGRT